MKVTMGLMMIAKYAILVTLQGSQALEGINAMAMQQGGIGLIMTVLLISCPPLAAQFFNATIGQISAYNAFSQSGQQARDAAGNPLGGGSNRVANTNTDYSDSDNGRMSLPHNSPTRTVTSTETGLGDNIKPASGSHKGRAQ